MSRKIIVIKPFKFAHAGIHVEEFTPSSEPIDTTDECADVAITEKWAKAFKPRGSESQSQAQAQASNEGAPEQAASAESPETKAE